MPLFLQVLDRYHQRIVANAERVLKEGPSARDAIERWLTGFVPFARGLREPVAAYRSIPQPMASPIRRRSATGSSASTET